MNNYSQALANTTEHFPTDTDGLPEAGPPQAVTLVDGDEVDLCIAPVVKRLGYETVRMIAYNATVPGPTLRVRQGSAITVNVTNDVDLDATVHWHGLRLDNAYDGTTQTQAPMGQGQSFRYQLTFPDPGIYWYHPHIREDYGQEMGLYGNILVEPAEADYWPPVHREELLTLDDILLEDGQVATFSRSETTHVAMGRFGNTMLTGGQPHVTLDAKLGEVVRFYLTNTANTRVFNVSFTGARMKLVGGDSGRYEHEELVPAVMLAPSERTVVDVLFDSPGQVSLEHRHPERTYELATITVREVRAEPPLAQKFDQLRTNPDMAAERERLAPFLNAAPDKTLAFIAEMDMGVPEGAVVYACPMHPDIISAVEGSCPKCGMRLLATAAPVTYVCPMHPEVVSAEQGHCPRCGMKLVAVAPTYACPMHPDVVSESPDHCPRCGMKLLLMLPQPAMHDDDSPSEAHDHHHHAAAPAEHPSDHHGHAAGHPGPMSHDAPHSQTHQAAGATSGHEVSGGIEWEDDMVDVNRTTTPTNMRWKLVDRTTTAENHAIDWQFRVGDQVKIRLVNEMDSDHPMHHPFHVHGAGRFLVLSRDGTVEPNLVWKDTVLVRTGETVDILLDVTNPGVWMAHCHIAEHHESGMMFTFNVAA